MLMSHFDEPKLSDDEEPPTEQDKRKKRVRRTQTHTKIILQPFLHSKVPLSALLMTKTAHYSFMQFGSLLRSACEDRNKVKSKRGNLRSNWHFRFFRFILQQQYNQNETEKTPSMSPCYPTPTPSGRGSQQNCKAKKSPQYPATRKIMERKQTVPSHATQGHHKS